MSHEDDVAPPSERKFGLTIGAVLFVLGALPVLWGGHFRSWLSLAGAAFAVLGLVAPATLKYPNLIWFRFGMILHRILNPLVLGALFVVVVTPLALIARVTGKKLLNRSYDPGAPSYWITRTPPGPAPDSIRNQF